MTIDQIKTAADTNIRAKTADNSVTRDEVADLFDSLADEQRDRGLYGVDTTAGLAAVSGANYRKVAVGDTGIFEWASTGTANGTTIFAASGGGVWVLKMSTQQSSVLDLILKKVGIDITSLLNAEISTGNYKRAVIRNINTINGTLTLPEGFELYFENGGKLTGSGTVEGGIINAPAQSHIFDTSLTINPEYCSDGWFSGRWYGANPANTDNYLQLQKAIDISIKNNLSSIYLPSGKYYISKGLLFINNNNGSGIYNQQVSIDFFGDKKVATHGDQETIIECTHNDNFAIGVHLGKSCSFKNITIKGVNQLNYDRETAWNQNTTYITNGSRDNRYSPYAGICIDPFADLTPSIDRYPGFGSYYGNIYTVGGSTECEFENIFLDGFTVGFVTSPNGYSYNAESFKLQNIWISNCKYGYVSCNSQEKLNVLENILVSNSVHTVISTKTYGDYFGDVPIILNMNVGGNVFKLFDVYPSYSEIFRVKDSHFEGFYSVGVVHSFTEFQNCVFLISSVTDLTTYGERSNILEAGMSSLKFNNCHFSIANNVPYFPFNVKLSNYSPGSNSHKVLYFENSSISIPSFTTNITTDYDNYVGINNCDIYQLGHSSESELLIKSGDGFITSPSQYLYNLTLGTTIKYLPSNNFQQNNEIITHKVSSGIIRTSEDEFNVTLNLTKINNSTATIDLDDAINLKYTCKPGDPIYSKTAITDRFGFSYTGQIGIITSIDINNIATIGYLTDGVITGTYLLYTKSVQKSRVPFVGDLTSGSNIITNVASVNNWGVGDRIFINEFIRGVYITNIGNDNTVTVSAPALVTKSKVVISNYSYIEDIAINGDINQLTFYKNIPVRKGTEIKDLSNGLVYDWKVITSGQLSTTNPPVVVPGKLKPMTGTEAETFSLGVNEKGLTVYITTPSTGFSAIGYWVWNGSSWEKLSVSSIPINDLSDVIIISPENNQVLKYNGTNWVNANISGGIPQNGIVLENTVDDAWTELLKLEANSIAGNTTGSLVFKVYTDGSNRILYGEMSNLSSFSFGPGFVGFSGIDLGNGGILSNYHSDLLLKLNSNAVNPTTAIKFRVEDLGFAPLSVWQTGEVSIGSAAISSPNSKAILELSSTTKGFLLPRMTKTQRDAITSPAAGLVIYQTDNTPGLRCYNGTNWMRYTETAD